MPRKRLLFSALAAGGLAVALAAPAAAHVTATPGEATQGDFTAFAFRVPNERPDAGTVRVEVTLPTEHPISALRTRPVPGWTAEVVTEGDAVRRVIWTARQGTRIAPDQYQEFEVSGGPLPDDTDQLVMPTRQTYDSGEVVNWDEPPTDGAEPEHPAPVLELLPAGEGGAHGAGNEHGPAVSNTAAEEAVTTDSTARWLGGGGLALGALGLGLGAGSVLRSRRGGGGT